MDAIAPAHRVPAAWRGVMGRIAQLIADRGAHPGRVVVLVPYAQLMPLAMRLWAIEHPDGFAPRFETTMNWASREGFAPGEDDIGFDMGRDLLVARSWLERAALGSRADLLAGRLVEAAWQLGGAAAAVPPAERAEWARSARAAVAAGTDAPALQLEAAVARIAVEWAAASSYASDALLQAPAVNTLDLLVVLEGFASEPMTAALQALFAGKTASVLLNATAPGEARLYPAADPSQEAEMAAACVLRHLQSGRSPVALAAIDRVLTRRVGAMLAARQVSIRDETGWKLSTTRAGAHAMGALRACDWNAGSDAVLDWLKNAPAFDQRAVSALERRVRRESLREWRQVAAEAPHWPGTIAALVESAQALRGVLQGPRMLPRWLQGLRELLQASGHWKSLAHDAAGSKLIEVLGLSEEEQLFWQQMRHAGRRFSQGGFASWIGDALEATTFRPNAPPGEPQVVILPFNQLLGREVAAVVMPGCDENSLPLSPEPPGPWTASQRALLGLPSREALEQERRAGWRNALETAHVDVLWRTSDDRGEPVLASSLVQALRMDSLALPAGEPREAREIAVAPVARPTPQGTLLPVAQWSASAYGDLRQCPYRFFALRQLGLQESTEIDTALDKRDFGNWLHKVLAAFHDALHATREPPGPGRARLLDITAQEVTRAQGLDDGDFLPFAAAWPRTRDGYLAWLGKHEAQGAVFTEAEAEREMHLGAQKLVGRIDRIDRAADGTLLVMDYKTEALATTARRTRDPAEDTQLAFYGALFADDTLRAGYVNVGEGGETSWREQAQVVEARDMLVAGLLHDAAAIAQGAALPALGEGKGCEYCAARGLCRKDMWA